MNDLGFYKSIYDRELARRLDLDNALNIPIGVIAILIGVISYIIGDISKCTNFVIQCLIIGFMIISAILIFISIFFLARSYNNVLRGHDYRNLDFTKKIRKYQTDLASYNSKVTENKIDFESTLIENLNHFTDIHILINDFRQISLYYAKSLIIGSAFSILIALLLFITNKYLL
jgi:hypothetical protein